MNKEEAASELRRRWVSMIEQYKICESLGLYIFINDRYTIWPRTYPSISISETKKY